MGLAQDCLRFVFKWVAAPLLAADLIVSAVQVPFTKEHQQNMDGFSRFADNLGSNAYKGFKVLAGGVYREVSVDVKRLGDSEEGKNALDTLSKGAERVRERLSGYNEGYKVNSDDYRDPNAGCKYDDSCAPE